ncbi:hypothetical protein ACROYT_G014771 [Oculina patagonica]
MDRQSFMDIADELRPYLQPRRSPRGLDVLSVEKQLGITLYYLLMQPLENPHDYFSYKMKYTLNVQGTCNWRGLFIDDDVRRPGSVHDGRVFANSRINKLLKEEKLPMLYKELLPGHDKVPVTLLSDPAYPLLPYCKKAFPSALNNEQVIFNNMLRSARNPIEFAFGRLKARWQILNKRIDMGLKFVPNIVHACFVLHNICKMKGVTIDDDIVAQQIAQDTIIALLFWPRKLDVGADIAARITAKGKKEAVANIFKPASTIVNEVLLQELTDAPCPGLPKPVYLIKAANHLQICPGLNANEMHVLHDRHHKVSSLIKVHQNTPKSVTYEVIWKCQIT